MRKTNTKILLRQIQRNPSLAEKFHDLTKNEDLAVFTAKDLKKFPDSWIKIHFKTYPRFRAFKPQLSKKSNYLIEIINKRISTRTFTRKAISYETFCSLIINSAGINRFTDNIDDSRRAYPSAGARYPLELYALVMNVEGLQKGLYHYNVKENLLEMLIEEDVWPYVYKSFGGDMSLKNAAVIFIISGTLMRTSVKYQNRGYRYMCIESGHIAQNICLLATESNLGVYTLGGFIDDQLLDLLDLSVQNTEFPLYTIAVGQK
ncbi:MAG TPA: SagB/ThcOx family dehydrogenase [Patescibacteria group bacterium]